MQNDRKSLIVLMLLLFIASLYLIMPFWRPLTLAAILSVLCFPIFARINRAMPKRPRLAAAFATLVIFAIIIVPSGLIVTMLVNQAYSGLQDFDLRTLFSNLFSNPIYQNYLLPYVSRLEQVFNIEINLFDIFTNLGKEAAKRVSAFSPQVLVGTAAFILDFFVMLFSIYVFFLEGPRLIRLGIRMSPLRETHEWRLLHQFRNMIYASVYGYLLTSLTQAVLATIGFAVAGVSAFLVLGTLTFFTSLIPIVGAAGGWLPVSLWFLLQGDWVRGIGLLIYGAVVISGIDNIVKPWIIQGRTNIHPLIIFFAIFGGLMLFGPIGILLGPVIAALFVATIHIYSEEFI